jgi:hypothetical protein
MSQTPDSESVIVDADSVSRALSDLIEGLPFLLTALRDAWRDASLSPERRLGARILVTRIGATFKSIEQLIEKVETRPATLSWARQVMDSAEAPEPLREVIRVLGAARIQDREFDRDLDTLYREARVRLAVLESGGLDGPEQQEAGL